MTDEELIARLRTLHLAKDCIAAADRIEALVKERINDALTLIAAQRQAQQAEARAKRLEDALRIIAGNNCITCSAEAFNALFAERPSSATLKGADHE